MRTTRLLTRLLGLNNVRVRGAEFEGDTLIIDVCPTWKRARCSCCGAKSPAYDQRERRGRHLDVAGVRCKLRYSIRRVERSKCGVKVERVPWADPDTGFTQPFDELVALLAQKTDKTTVANLLRIAWTSVGRSIERVVQRYGGEPEARIQGLRRIGIDELSYRKGHKYVTIVTDLDTHRIVWVVEGRKAEDLDGFFDALGPKGIAALEVAAIDTSKSYQKALRDRVPHVDVVFDRFHVQKLVHDAIDEIRRGLVAKATDPADKEALKKTRRALQRSPWRLSHKDLRKLKTLEKVNAPLYRAYLMKEALAALFDSASPDEIHKLLLDWLDWVEAEGEPPLVRAAESIAKHFDGVVAYLEIGATNALTEGLNRKARVVTSRAYGFRSVKSFMSMLLLCCGGIVLNWPHVIPL